MMESNEFIELLFELKEKAIKENYDNRIVALINLVVNNGDVVELLNDEINEE